MHVDAVIDFEIVRLHRYSLHTKAVIAGNQLLRDNRILDPTTNPIGDVLREFGVGFFIREYFAEVAQPYRKPRAVIEPVPQRNPLLAGDLIKATPVRLMLEAARRTSTRLEDLVVARTDVGHLRVRDRSVV